MLSLNQSNESETLIAKNVFLPGTGLFLLLDFYYFGDEKNIGSRMECG